MMKDKDDRSIDQLLEILAKTEKAIRWNERTIRDAYTLGKYIIHLTEGFKRTFSGLGDDIVDCADSEVWKQTRRMLLCLLDHGCNTCFEAMVSTILYKRVLQNCYRLKDKKNADARRAKEFFETLSLCLREEGAHSDTIRVATDLLADMQEAQKEAFHAVKINGETYQSYADRTDIPIGTVRSYCWRGSREVRKGLDGST